MKRIALIAALLTLALTACSQKTEAPAVVVVPPPVIAPDAASAPVAAPADAMKK